MTTLPPTPIGTTVGTWGDWSPNF